MRHALTHQAGVPAIRERLTNDDLWQWQRMADAVARTDAVQEQRRRVQDLLSLLSLMDGLAQRFFESNRGLRTAVELLANKKEKN